jgi:protein tyrosine phosphatase (PTP) superfamily phosphohydrolase (DUF442 family)
MGTEAIFNYRRAGPRVIAGGQPTAEQLRAAAAEGVEVVVNISTNDPRYALPGEQELIESLGMTYHHLPVLWDAPQLADWEAFNALMNNLREQSVLVHCAANYRVSAFYALHALANGRWSADEAEQFIRSVWNPDEHPQWAAFIESVRTRIG